MSAAESGLSGPGGIRLFPGIPANHHHDCDRYIGRVGWVQVDGTWTQATVTGAHFPSDELTVYVNGQYVKVHYGEFVMAGNPQSA